MPSEQGNPDPPSIGERVAFHRRRRGLTRRALAELVGRSAEWLRLLEVEGRGAERLTSLVDLARALGLEDIAPLVGTTMRQVVPSGLPEHPAVPQVRSAMHRALLTPVAPDGQAPSLQALRGRVEQAWTGWRISRTQFTALGAVLPGLLSDTIAAARAAPPTDRRTAHLLLTHAYLLAQRFASCTGSTSLAIQCSDRAMLAADVADDPELLALSAWASAMSSLQAGRPGDAAEIALFASGRLAAPATWQQAAVRGSLLLFAAVGTARVCRPADAWRLWDEAAGLSDQIGPSAQHPYTQFSGANVMVYGVVLDIETGNATAAAERVSRLDPAQIPSSNRRAQHYIDLAHSHERAGRRAEVLPVLLASAQESTETIVYSTQARTLVGSLLRRTDPAADPGLTRLTTLLGMT